MESMGNKHWLIGNEEKENHFQKMHYYLVIFCFNNKSSHVDLTLLYRKPEKSILSYKVNN